MESVGKVYRFERREGQSSHLLTNGLLHKKSVTGHVAHKLASGCISVKEAHFLIP